MTLADAKHAHARVMATLDGEIPDDKRCSLANLQIALMDTVKSDLGVELGETHDVPETWELSPFATLIIRQIDAELSGV